MLLPVLARAGVAPRDRRLIAWFGPRGLSSLLLILLPVFAGMPGSERLFADHLPGGAALGRPARRRHRGVSPEGRRARALRSTHRRRVAPQAAPAAPEAPVPERITIAEMRQLQEAGEPVMLADVRTDRSYEADNLQAAGRLRLPPDDAVRRARELGLDHHGTVVLYCA